MNVDDVTMTSYEWIRTSLQRHCSVTATLLQPRCRVIATSLQRHTPHVASLTNSPSMPRGWLLMTSGVIWRLFDIDGNLLFHVQLNMPLAITSIVTLFRRIKSNQHTHRLSENWIWMANKLLTWAMMQCTVLANTAASELLRAMVCDLQFLLPLAVPWSSHRSLKTAKVTWILCPIFIGWGSPTMLSQQQGAYRLWFGD